MPRGYALSEATTEKIWELRAQGLSEREIGLGLGLGINTVSLYLRALGGIRPRARHGKRVYRPSRDTARAMSEENVKVVRRKLDAISRGDVDEAFGDVAPEFELDMSQALGMYRGVYGVDQVRGFVSEFTSTFESFHAEADRYIDAGAHVVTPFTNTGRSRGGMEVRARGVWVWTFRDGAVARVCLYQELPDALDAAGLSE